MRPIELASSMAAAAAVLVMGAAPASAGGQYVGANGGQAAQRAGAFVAKADDGSALWHNPAGLAGIPGRSLFLGVNVITMDQWYQRDGIYAGDPGAVWAGEPYPLVENQAPPQAVPLVVSTMKVGRFTIGSGLVAPQGHGRRKFPYRVGPDRRPSPQRFDTVLQDGYLGFNSIGVATELGNRLAIGGRIGAGFGRFQSVNVVQAVPRADEDPVIETASHLDVTDWFIVSGALGARLRVSEHVELGVAWTSPISVAARGTSRSAAGEGAIEVSPGVTTYLEPVPDDEARCAPGGTREAQRACLYFRMPQTVTVGVRLVARDAAGAEIGDVELDVRWEDWSAASDQRIVVDARDHLLGTRVNDIVIRHGLKDALSVHLGAARTAQVHDRAITTRLGLAYEAAAAPDSWTRLDLDAGERYTLGLGVGIQLTPQVHLDAGAVWIESPRRVVRDGTDPDERAQPDVTVPIYDADAQPHHPFNAGAYGTRYVIGSVATRILW